MSAATTVPETRHQSAGDVRDQLRRTGTARSFRDVALRFRVAEGTSYTRALGHSSVLTLIPAAIAMIGLVTAFDMVRLKGVLEDAATSFAPARRVASSRRPSLGRKHSSGTTVLIAGLAGMLFSGTVGMTHLERAANRIYGVAEGRSPRRRYALAFALAATVGAC